MLTNLPLEEAEEVALLLGSVASASVGELTLKPFEHCTFAAAVHLQRNKMMPDH